MLEDLEGNDRIEPIDRAWDKVIKALALNVANVNLETSGPGFTDRDLRSIHPDRGVARASKRFERPAWSASNIEEAPFGNACLRKEIERETGPLAASVRGPGTIAPSPVAVVKALRIKHQ